MGTIRSLTVAMQAQTAGFTKPMADAEHSMKSFESSAKGGKDVMKGIASAAELAGVESKSLSGALDATAAAADLAKAAMAGSELAAKGLGAAFSILTGPAGIALTAIAAIAAAVAVFAEETDRAKMKAEQDKKDKETQKDVLGSLREEYEKLNYSEEELALHKLDVANATAAQIDQAKMYLELNAESKKEAEEKKKAEEDEKKRKEDITSLLAGLADGNKKLALSENDYIRAQAEKLKLNKEQMAQLEQLLAEQDALNAAKAKEKEVKEKFEKGQQITSDQRDATRQSTDDRVAAEKRAQAQIAALQAGAGKSAAEHAGEVAAIEAASDAQKQLLTEQLYRLGLSGEQVAAVRREVDLQKANKLAILETQTAAKKAFDDVEQANKQKEDWAKKAAKAGEDIAKRQADKDPLAGAMAEAQKVRESLTKGLLDPAAADTLMQDIAERAQESLQKLREDARPDNKAGVSARLGLTGLDFLKADAGQKKNPAEETNQILRRIESSLSGGVGIHSMN